MNKLFIADKDFSREISRKRAKGYSRVVVDSALEIASPFEFKTDGTDLVAMPVEYEEGAEDCYTILCKEFGLIGFKNSGYMSKVSVIFCDNGQMLVTLKNGGIIVNLDDQLLMPMVGDSMKSGEVIRDNIFWVDAQQLLGYSKYMKGNRGHFMYDYEFSFEVGGDNNNGMSEFKLKTHEDEDIDISQGYIALWEQQQITHQEAKEARQMVQSVFNWKNEEREFDEAYGAVPDQPEEEEDDSGVEWD